MTVLHQGNRYGFSVGTLLVWLVTTCMCGVFMTDQISAGEPSGLATATFGGGCFWCTEAVFEKLIGVEAVISGYAGGDASNANYNAVANGLTDHTETIQIYFDSDVISFDKLVEIFFLAAHDPTQLNRQGPDIGRQYRSSVFYHNLEQKKIVQAWIVKLTDQKYFKSPIVTELVRYREFYTAEKYHQDYVKYNSKNPYVQSVAMPKIKKFEAKYSDLLKH